MWCYYFYCIAIASWIPLTDVWNWCSRTLIPLLILLLIHPTMHIKDIVNYVFSTYLTLLNRVPGLSWSWSSRHCTLWGARSIPTSCHSWRRQVFTAHPHYILQRHKREHWLAVLTGFPPFLENIFCNSMTEVLAPYTSTHAFEMCHFWQLYLAFFFFFTFAAMFILLLSPRSLALKKFSLWL